MSDRTTRLLRDGLAGDAGQFEAFIERVTPLLVAVARRCTRSLAARGIDPDDVVQNAWAACLPRLGALQARDGRMTPVVVKYLSQAIQRRARDLLVAAARRAGPAPGRSQDGVVDLAAETLGVVTRVLKAERHGQVLAAIEALEPIDRDALVMLSIEQTPLAEAALILGISSDAAKQRHLRARQRLRAELPDSLFGELD